MRTDITFTSEDGTALAAWLYLPEGSNPLSQDGLVPCVVMSHGFTALRTMGLDEYAQIFADAGLACLVYDHRNWGDSGGEPRFETDPWRQLSDMRDAVTFVRTVPQVDSSRVGVWGTSYAGGHALMIGALDRRVQAVVAQVPLVDGLGFFRTAVKGGGEKLLARLVADRDARFRGEPPQTVRSAVDGSTTAEWAALVDVEGVWPNRMTLRSLELVASYMPKDFAAQIAPTPLLMLVAEEDEITPSGPQLEAFEAAGTPKELLRFPCRHYDVYTALQAETAAAARDFLVRHLAPQAVPTGAA
jgi:cephalosporin-C deacetylase-like acetyl esterase